MERIYLKFEKNVLYENIQIIIRKFQCYFQDNIIKPTLKDKG
jgi:hypothetical protein